MCMNFVVDVCTSPKARVEGCQQKSTFQW